MTDAPVTPKAPGWWAAGQAHLAAVDPVMAALVAQFPSGGLASRGAACETLVRAVVGQQISVTAADAIWRRFSGLGEGAMVPERILALDDEALRGAGLSYRKIGYVRGIAQGFADGTVHPARWADVSDEAVILELVRLPGIGRWTAEMFLIFHLMRPDVLPVDDLGLLKAFALYYGPVRGTARLEGMARWKKIGAALAVKGRVWAPYRTLATWYLWRSLDPVEVVY